MKTRGLLVASLALAFAPLAPMAHAQVSITCEMCVTVAANGHSDTICHPVACPGPGSKKAPYKAMVHVPEGSACSLKTSHGVSVDGTTSGKSCLLSRSLRPEELKPPG